MRIENLRDSGYNQGPMTVTRRINILFACCLALFLIGAFGLPGYCVVSILPSASPTFSDYVDFMTFLANALVVMGAIAICVIGCQRLRRPPSKPQRSNGYQS